MIIWIGCALLFIGDLVFGFWAMVLSIKTEDCRAPGGKPYTIWHSWKSALRKNPSDYTEAGQTYLSKALKVEFAFAAWNIFMIGVLGLASAGK